MSQWFVVAVKTSHWVLCWQTVWAHSVGSCPSCPWRSRWRPSSAPSIQNRFDYSEAKEPISKQVARQSDYINVSGQYLPDVSTQDWSSCSSSTPCSACTVYADNLKPEDKERKKKKRFLFSATGKKVLDTTGLIHNYPKRSCLVTSLIFSIVCGVTQVICACFIPTSVRAAGGVGQLLSRTFLGRFLRSVMRKE